LQLATVSSDEVHVWMGAVRAGRSPREIADRRAAVDGMLRRVLATHLEADPEEVEVGYGEHGKPRLEGPGGLEFNLSHSAELVLVAVARGREVGVDVERIDPGRGRSPAFCGSWVSREARLKCLGVGFAAPVPADPVTVASFDVGPGYAAALALAGAGPARLRGRTFEPPRRKAVRGVS
jgi:phosphopantetheinyl transferase